MRSTKLMQKYQVELPPPKPATSIYILYRRLCFLFDDIIVLLFKHDKVKIKDFVCKRLRESIYTATFCDTYLCCGRYCNRMDPYTYFQAYTWYCIHKKDDM